MSWKLVSTYFENIAKEHLSIGHDPNNDKERFFVVELERALNGEVYDMNWDDIALIMPNVSGAPKDSGGDSKLEMSIQLFVLGYAENQDYQSQKAVYEKTEEVALEILKRCKKDSIEQHEIDGKSVFYGSLDHLDGVSLIQTTFPTSNQSRGWQINFKISPHLNTCIDATKWNDIS